MKEQKLLRLLKEMLRNSKRSDREIAKTIGVSQPTVTRARARLEKDYINTYTVIPDFAKLGYQILAFTFLKMRSYPSQEAAEELIRNAREWTSGNPNVVFAANGEGLGKDALMISFHKNYPSYSDFTRKLTTNWSDAVSELSSFLVSIGPDYPARAIKSFDLKYLADDL